MSVAKCLPLIFIEKSFDNNEEKNHCNQVPSIHYYHLIFPYHYDNSNKKRLILKIFTFSHRYWLWHSVVCY